jgi:hypothetical protein
VEAQIPRRRVMRTWHAAVPHEDRDQHRRLGAGRRGLPVGGVERREVEPGAASPPGPAQRVERSSDRRGGGRIGGGASSRGSTPCRRSTATSAPRTSRQATKR